MPDFIGPLLAFSCFVSLDKSHVSWLKNTRHRQACKYSSLLRWFLSERKDYFVGLGNAIV